MFFKGHIKSYYEICRRGKQLLKAKGGARKQTLTTNIQANLNWDKGVSASLVCEMWRYENLELSQLYR